MHQVLHADDRGPTKYFHGRDAIRSLFAERLNHYDQLCGGSTFLITGAPGAGKSALLDVLGKDADKMGWNVKTEISPEHFASPARMARALGVKYVRRKSRPVTLSVKVLRKVWRSEKDTAPGVADVIKKASKSRPLILVLDEAQHLHNIASIDAYRVVATGAMDALHNGKIGYPYILLAGGLDTSENALSDLGVSRITSSNKVRLGPMEMEEAKRVIVDYVHGEFGESVPDHWLSAIAEPTHGWPQHIVCYANAVGNKLISLSRSPTGDDLDEALRNGWDIQMDYYEARAHDITWGQRAILAHLVAEIPVWGTLSKSHVVSALAEKYSQEVAEATFTRALRQGVLSKVKGGGYGVPIPSMHRWLVDEYATN
ncbi:MAG: ATP-binding protein [Bacteroidetes bacterium]|nr:ATP-binding protein [Bacteroidota bacterium]